MTGRRVHGIALLLVGLLVASSWISVIDFTGDNRVQSLEQEESPYAVGEGGDMDLTLTTTANNAFKLDLPNNEPLVSAEFNFKPKILPTQSGFVWDEAADWNHPDAINNGSSVVNGALSGTSSGVLWDFNTNNQGWTFSNTYTARVTSPACGYNGTTGGSLRTYAGSTYGTSPTVNLAGGVNIPFHAWVHEGRSGCGETPDSGENLQFQYKTASGSWTTFNTFSGGGSQTTNFQYMTTLPAAALHTNSQFRIHQTSGSSTCCDYWFVDDVHIATPPASNWTSPTMGSKAGSTQLLAADTYAPLYIEATIPPEAFLNWSILNAAGEVIPGMHGTNEMVVPLNLLDYQTVDEFRLHLEFAASVNGMPAVYSIAGDGSARESFHSPPDQRGWVLNGSTFSPLTGQVVGIANASLTSPWFLANAPVYDAKVDGTMTNAQIQVRHHPLQPWTNITLPYTPIVTPETVGMQLRAVALPPTDGNMSNFTTWSVNSLHHDMFGGQVPARPALDFNLDERYEWGGVDERVGSWGWQDRFVNGEEQISLPLVSGAPTVTKAWVPKDDLSSFAFSFVAQSGSIRDVALFVQNDFIANRSFDAATAGVMQLNVSEFELMAYELSMVSNSLDILGTDFTEIRIEVSGSGTVVLGGLRATYNASHNLQADASSSFVMGLNEARTSVPNVGGMQAIPMPFVASERGGLTIEVIDLQTSATVLLQDGDMRNTQAVLTPSQDWQTIETEYQVFGGTVTHYRLDVFSKSHQATWLFPASGGSPAGLGDADLVEIHPDSPIEALVDGSTVTANITFRLRPMWDDEMQLTATSRLVLQSGVISIPFSHTWGDLNNQGYENDLEIKAMTFSDADGVMPSTRQYLQGGTSMNLSVEIGFEGLTSAGAFVDGDAELTLYRDGSAVINTTTLDGVYWNITETIPFTYGDVTWTVRLVSLNGSTIIEPNEVARTFTVDSVKPRVLESSMYQYDHRTPSPTQVLQVTIMDQPILPAAMNAMVWKEWVDDDNLNGLPDEGEYSPVAMLLPSDRTALTGIYTLMMDDTAGSLGQKVAVYLEGTDPSGYAIQQGGSAEEGQQLTVYQLAVDGAPTLDPDAFSWADGRKSWLHPGQPYQLDVKITEPNGGSDLDTVEVMLASNQGSDTMSIIWDFESGNCTTESIHIFIEDCTMMGENGVAGPFEKDMLLQIDLTFGWNTPDLGDNRREPAILVIDRAGQEESRNFPEHRWRFSAGLSIPEESVNLFLTRGSFLGDGARVTPLTPMEISGGLVFAETSTVPVFDCEVNLLFAGSTYTATAYDGIWSTPLEAPAVSGALPLTWEVGCLEGQGVDLTDKETSVKWILVDGTGPNPVEILSPRPLAILGGEGHDVRIVIEELGGLDVQSLELVWVVEDFETRDTIRSGREALNLMGTELDGLRLELSTEMNLSEITDSMLIDRMVVKIYVEGRDLAGNEVTGLNGGVSGTSIATWNMEWLQPEFTVSPSSMTYSRLLLEVGDTTSIQLEVENTGTLEGSVDIIFESVELDGTRSEIQRTSVTADAGGVGIVTLDWGPERPGVQWIEATLENGAMSSGPTVDVRVSEDPGFTEKVFGDVNPVIGAITTLLFISIVVTLLLWLKRMTVNQGSKIAYDWDEYSDELEDDYDDDDDDEMEQRAALSATASAAASTSSSTEEETDWVMGSDGYWWYHDKATNEWWYKDEHGEIVKHP